MKILGAILILGTLCLAVALTEGYKDNTLSRATELVYKTGVLIVDPVVPRDEYNVVTNMRLNVEGESYYLSIPGKVLRKLDPAVFKLKEGQTIKYAIKKHTSAFSKLGNRRIVFGLENDQRQILNQEQAIEYYGKTNDSIVRAAFVLTLLVGVCIYYWVRR